MFQIFWLPWVIVDSHCHGRDLKQARKTTLEQVLHEALLAHISITCFQPNTDLPLTSLVRLTEYLGLIIRAKNKLSIWPKQYVWFGATDDNLRECQLALQNDFVIGAKIYPRDEAGKSVTTGSQIGVARDKTITSILKLARAAGKVVAVHCDDPKIIVSEGYTIRAEVEYVRKIIRLAKMMPGVKVLICHVSCRESAELILEAQAQGMLIAMELMPQYLWFDSDGTNWNPALDPKFYDCLNRLRPAPHREFLVRQLWTKNQLLWVASDSACHLDAEKLAGASGIPSNQEMVPVVVTLATMFGIPKERVAELLSWNAADFLGIKAPRKLRPYQLIEKIDDLQYNNGKVVNPWNGSRLLFPVPLS
ncbi:MAG: dihydroorotase family protein [Patescibacteria group bacterium]|nr:dihydroorotase family protein [Patescibacteria group bacterium]MDD4610590.1 dihydroorotase family protein [Patescibacteria group bacterium]